MHEHAYYFYTLLGFRFVWWDKNKIMVTHYDPYPDEYEQTLFCGTPETENTYTDNNWKYVSCKKCLKMKDKAKKFVEETEKVILNQMQGFVDFHNEQERKANEA